MWTWCPDLRASRLKTYQCTWCDIDSTPHPSVPAPASREQICCPWPEETLQASFCQVSWQMMRIRRTAAWYLFSAMFPILISDRFQFLSIYLSQIFHGHLECFTRHSVLTTCAGCTNVSWDRLQPPRDPYGISGYRKWMDSVLTHTLTKVLLYSNSPVRQSTSVSRPWNWSS